MKWFERPEVLSYLIDSYQGVDVVDGCQQRQFLWEEPNGDILIGNSRAFTDHMIKKFNLPIGDKSWSVLHGVLRDLGEIVKPHTKKDLYLGQKFRNQEPKTRLLKKGTR